MRWRPCRGHASIVLRALFMRLPVHARGALVVDLHAIHAAIALAGVGIARKHQRQGDEAAAILRPAFQHRIIEQGKAPGADDLLARAFGHDLGKERSHLGQLWQHLQLADEAFGHAHFQVFRDALRHGLDRVHLQRDLHLAHAGEAVDQHRNAIALGLFKQQRGAAGFDRAVGEIRDFQDGVHFKGDALELLVLLQRGDEFTQIGVGHSVTLTGRLSFYYD